MTPTEIVAKQEIRSLLSKIEAELDDVNWCNAEDCALQVLHTIRTVISIKSNATQVRARRLGISLDTADFKVQHPTIFEKCGADCVHPEHAND